jgi:hypothetical protein
MNITSDNIVTVSAAIVGALGAIGGVIVANRLTYARSNRERLWDLRRQAYGVILSELAAVEHICDSVDEYVNERSYEEYFNTKSRDRLEAEKAKRMDVVRTRYSNDYLILSEEFIKAYDKFTADASSDPYNDTPPEEHEKFSKGLRENRPRLMALARNEITAKKDLRWPLTWSRWLFSS